MLLAKPTYLYLTVIPHRLTAVAAAECVTLTGEAPDVHGIAISAQCVDIRRGAYLKSCTEVLFEAECLAELCRDIRAAELHADEFRVSVVKKPRSLKLNSLELARNIGSVIDGSVNLNAPQVTFLTVVTSEKIWLGHLLSESDGAWGRHARRPCMTSSSLPTRLARAVVNLVAQPGDRLLDPCCGTGTMLMAAAHGGIHAVGYDNNPRMVHATLKNLQHFGLSAEVALGDARHVHGQFDAIATDLPYGIGLIKDNVQQTEILANMRTCAPKAAFIHSQDISYYLNDIGYRVDAILPVPKLSIVRRIFIASVIT